MNRRAGPTLKGLHGLIAHTWLALRTEPEVQKRARGWVARGINAMQYDPHTQWRYHIFMSWLWLASAVPILVLFFGFPSEWLRWGVFITLMYSLYANFVSDFTGVHAAWSALRGDQIIVTAEKTADVIEDVSEHMDNGEDT